MNGLPISGHLVAQFSSNPVSLTAQIGPISVIIEFSKKNSTLCVVLPLKKIVLPSEYKALKR